MLRAGVIELIGAIDAVSKDGEDAVTVFLDPALYDKHFGEGVEAKAYRGVTVAPTGAP